MAKRTISVPVISRAELLNRLQQNDVPKDIVEFINRTVENAFKPCKPSNRN